MNIGDRVKLNFDELAKEFDVAWIKWAKDYYNSGVGTIVEIKNYRKILSDPRINYLTARIKWDDEKLNKSYVEFKGQTLKIINLNLNYIMKITNLVKKILDKDTRTLVEAGYINGDLALTDEGTLELLSILFLKHKNELVKIAQDKIEEKK